MPAAQSRDPGFAYTMLPNDGMISLHLGRVILKRTGEVRGRISTPITPPVSAGRAKGRALTGLVRKD